jgi:DNA-binding NarL/FixJ family response regulator
LIARHVLRRFQQGGKVANETPALQCTQATPSLGATASLSARERQVLDLITKGFSYEEIANLMQISRYTVMTFVRRIYAKLEVNSKTEAIYEARLQGLLPP